MTRRVLLSSLALAGCGSRERPIRLGIAAQQSISQIPVYLASRLGYLPQVELSEFPGASKGMEALLGGSVDVLSGYYSQVLQLRAQGRALKAFACFYDSLLIALAVSPAAATRCRSLADLKGAKVGVTTLGSATHQFLDFLLRKAGVTGVTPVAIGTASRAAAAMERGHVDAGVVTDFTIRYLEKRFGRVSLLADTRTRAGTAAVHGVDSFPGTVLLSDEKWLDRERESATRLAKAVSDAVAWMRSTTVSRIVEAMPPSHYGEDRETYVTAVSNSLPMLSTTVAPDEPEHQAVLAFLGIPEGIRLQDAFSRLPLKA